MLLSVCLCLCVAGLVDQAGVSQSAHLVSRRRPLHVYDALALHYRISLFVRHPRDRVSSVSSCRCGLAWFTWLCGLADRAPGRADGSAARHNGLQRHILRHQPAGDDAVLATRPYVLARRSYDDADAADAKEEDEDEDKDLEWSL